MLNRYVFILLIFSACGERSQRSDTSTLNGKSQEYIWTKLSDTSHFVPSDRIQFMNIRDTLWAFHPRGAYYSADGVKFEQSPLGAKLSASAIAGYFFFNNKLISIITTRDPNTADSVSMITFKSADLLQWNLKVTAKDLAITITTPLIWFKNKIWLFGTRDSLDHYASAWNSGDAVHWTKIADSIPIGPISNQRLIVFKKKLLLLSDQLWESEDGSRWKKAPTTAIPSLKKSAPVQFNDLLWIFGAGSGVEGGPKILVSSDARKWDTIDAPWPERSSPAVCVYRGKIFLAGGNHPVISGQQPGDSLLNDIWQLEKQD